MPTFKELIEKKNDLITRAEETLNKAKEEKRELTDDEAQELAEIRDNVRKIVDTLKLDDDFKDLDKPMEKKPDDTPTDAVTPKEGDDVTKQEQRAVEDNDRKAFENYIRGRVVNERAGELTKTDNGAVIPTTIA